MAAQVYAAAAAAVVAGIESGPPITRKDSASSLKGPELSYGRRTAGRQREEGTVTTRVVRSSTGSAAVRPQLISQTSQAAVDHAAPTEPSQVAPASKQSAAAAKADAAADGEAVAAAEHTAMLNRFRAQWNITKRDSLWTRLHKGAEWRLFWMGHATGICILDFEERVVCTGLYCAVLGLLAFEGCRRLLGGLAGMW